MERQQELVCVPSNGAISSDFEMASTLNNLIFDILYRLLYLYSG